MGRYHGASIFKALITATNEVGEIRIQFHVVTDGHDQMEAPIKAFLETMNEYGQDEVELLATDNPFGDKDFFLQAIASLRATQNALDHAAPPRPAPGLPMCVVDRTKFKVCRTSTDINSNVDAARNMVKGLPPHLRFMSLDAEWDTVKTSTGIVIAQGTIAVIQLSFKLSNSSDIHALVLQVHGKKTLPERLLSLFADPEVAFVGRAIGGDLKKMAKDFNCEAQTRHIKPIDLDRMARKRRLHLDTRGLWHGHHPHRAACYRNRSDRAATRTCRQALSSDARPALPLQGDGDQASAAPRPWGS